MSAPLPRAILLGALALTAACGSSAPLARADAASVDPEDGGPREDAADVDAGVADSGADAGGAADGGGADLGPTDSGEADSGAQDAGALDSGPTDAGAADAGAADAGATPGVPDPARAGPFAVGTAGGRPRASSGNTVPVDCRFPSGGGGAFPAVLIGHGFQISAAQYLGYAERLASFGYVACTVDFPAGLRANHVENAADTRAALDWLERVNGEAGHPLQGLVDTGLVGVMGHSLGGKVAFLVAAADPRVDAVLGLDPVDGGFLCPASRCPDATDMLPLPLPVGVLGETIDAMGGRMPCAPAADNYQTFYAAASSPALEVTVLGANHVSFVDDPATCGLPCRLCNAATAPHAQVIDLARAYTVAFFERHLRGETGYDAYLDGAIARMRYVQTMEASLRSK